MDAIFPEVLVFCDILARTTLVTALTMAGDRQNAMATAKHLVEVADSSPNPWARSFALLTYGYACCDADPAGARDALRRGLVIARDSGNRYSESHLANVLGRLEARHGEEHAALDYLSLAIRNYQNSGNISTMRVPLAALAAFLVRLGHHEPAAAIAGFAVSPMTTIWIPELGSAIVRLREVLSDEKYDALARKGETMTASAIAAYAYDQIDQARTELEQPC